MVGFIKLFVCGFVVGPLGTSQEPVLGDDRAPRVIETIEGQGLKTARRARLMKPKEIRIRRSLAPSPEAPVDREPESDLVVSGGNSP